MKKIPFLLIVLVAMLSACKEETCDVSFCDMTFHFTTPNDGSGQFPVEKLQLFLKDNVRDQISGPINFDPSALSASAEEDTEGMIHFSATQRIPRGDYTLWCWANVYDESVYSFDRYSLSMKENITGSYYLLGKASNLQITQRLMETSFDLTPVTTQVPVSIQMTYDKIISLYIADVANQVDASGNYSGATTMAYEADRFNDMPPATIYLFPPVENTTTENPTQSSEFSLTYQIGSTNYVEQTEVILQTGKIVPVTFAEP